MIDIPFTSFLLMTVILCLLSIATVGSFTFKNVLPSDTITEICQRIIGWWWIIGLLFMALWAGTTSAIVFFGFVSFLALKEFVSITATRTADRNAVFWSYLAIPLQYFWIAENWYGMFMIFIPVYIFLFMPMRLVIGGETKGFIKAVSTLQWANMLTVYCISHIAYLLNLPNPAETGGPIGLVLYLVFLSQFNDICQYIWGKAFGKVKILPKVSPNKTWEGFLGGAITTTIVGALLAQYLTPLNLIEGVAIGFLISVAGFFGDVVVSAVKRDLSIKDSGTLLPGHGGILDRIDSLTYAAPVFFHFIYYLKY